MKITISLPCFGRPERTIRAVESIVNQDINGWEAFVVGDGCPDMQKLISTGAFDELIKKAEQNGNVLSISNMPENKGGFGYSIINSNIKKATGDYFLFFSNDDVLLPNHFRNYLSGIENTDFDFVYFNTRIEPLKWSEEDKKRNGLGYWIRFSELKEGSIGHSEIIVRTEFLKLMPPHTPDYGHDWLLIDNMIKSGAMYKKDESNETTYIVKGVGDLREDIIN